VIRIVIVEEMSLLRRALCAVLSNEDDLEVVADLSATGDILSVVQATQPDVVVIDSELRGFNLLSEVQKLLAEAPEVAVLALSRRRSPQILREALQAGVRGFVGKDLAPAELARLVRAVAGGELVVDAVAAVAALKPPKSPLTKREREVLKIAAEGLPLKEIARRLYLAHGTVRNHLSAILRKTGSRNRMEAIRHAQRDGWL
jgi:two-component system response regulator DesR